METATANVRNSKVLSVSFRPELFNKINSYCAERGCSRSWFVSKAAELYLNECLEDKIDYETAVAAFERFEKSGKPGILLEDLREKLGV
ncbi:hypothetical protein V1L52_05420 [Treponema sp. HNW]|uniref:DUF6290 family protein n=1 Tax=Treponema sp. HNW TaxID=3116654 RepID=UPI003D0BD0A0